MTDSIVAECGIRQLHARFADAVARKDADAFAACFAQDGEWKIAGMHLRGRREISEAIARLLGYCQRVHLIVGTPLLDFGDGVATGRTAMTELAKRADGSSAMTLGTYYDRYVDEDGAWRFMRRHWTMHYNGPVDLSGPLIDSPDFGPPPALPGDDEPTYVRPK